MIPTAQFAKQTARVNGIDLKYVDFGGEGDPCLLLHGSPSHALSWARWVEHTDLPFHFVALEQRGQGESAKPDSGYSAVDLGHDAAVFWDQLGLGPAVVIGASMGGNTATAMAAERPDLVRAIILADPSYHTPEAVIEGALRAFAAAPPDMPDWDAVMAGLRKRQPSWSDDDLLAYYGGNVIQTDSGAWQMRHHLPALRQNYGHFRDDHRPLAAAVKAPALIVQAGERRILTDADAQDMHRTIKNSRLVTIEGAGHSVHFERQPEFDAAALLS